MCFDSEFSFLRPIFSSRSWLMITCDLMVLRRVELALRSGPMESALERSYNDGLKRGGERERERERSWACQICSSYKTISSHIILLLKKLRTYKMFVWSWYQKSSSVKVSSCHVHHRFSREKLRGCVIRSMTIDVDSKLGFQIISMWGHADNPSEKTHVKSSSRKLDDTGWWGKSTFRVASTHGTEFSAGCRVSARLW
jgi:hypothetical protein